ncbi:GGDEF domain-containing protein [Rhodococcus sp. H29-C3]|uniref:GGDEF domain-containing protein n=1 Tax=Rhodococcus sp. H29-C3 TaxID=3046307 RepID=UPI0024BBC6EE|nr:GGDEF domain-containing protein [Rhodococcus sp. H29-C3]MDJ0362070.1 GGDEF domain-containing protein [Rhodococcus sp. H29-C3]
MSIASPSAAAESEYSVGRRTAACLGVVAVVVGIVSTGILPKQLSVVLDDLAQLICGVAAASICWYTARHRTGSERRWRVLMAVGMACWSAGMLTWALYRSVLHTALPSPSYADIGFFLLPIFSVSALLAVVGKSPRRTEVGSTHAWITSVLDGMVIVGSLFVLSWSTALGHVVRSEETSSLRFLVALMYPITDLVLVIMVGLLAVIADVPRRYRAQLSLLGAGLVCVATSDSLYAYLVAIGAEEMPLVADAGFIAGPVLVALAASVPTGRPADNVGRTEGSTGAPSTRSTSPRLSPVCPPPFSPRPFSPRPSLVSVAGDRTQLLIPYALIALIGTFLCVQWAVHGSVDTVVLALFFAVVVLSLARQVMTLLQNDTLLRRLSEAQAELSYRAHHDGLTGLLNRSAFDDHLSTAIDLHNTTGRPGVLLLIDLDNFKAINDRLGHGAGDRLLEILSKRLADTVDGGEHGGVVARFGGDEFTVLIPAGIDAGRRAAKEIVDALREPREIEGHLVSIGASVGVVELNVFDGDVTADALVRSADRAMYEAKKSGKAGVFTYDCDGALRMVYNLDDKAAAFDWWPNHRNREIQRIPIGSGNQGSLGISPNIVAGEPDPARLIGPPTKT